MKSDFLLWVLLPYLCLGTFVLGHWWRYTHDKFGWTTRSSQSYETRILRLASPLFHFGMLGVIMGHVVGIVIPMRVTEFFGISEHTYHLGSVVGGVITGSMVLVGLALLLYRRVTVTSVRKVTTNNDRVMYLALAVVIALGAAATMSNAIGPVHEYRETVSPWWRSLFYFDPKPELMAAAPRVFQAHALSAWLLIALWPFTRLVHLFSAPVGYLTRPYVVYRSRNVPASRGLAAARRGWESD